MCSAAASKTTVTARSRASQGSSKPSKRKLAVENRITVRPHSRVVVTAGGNLAFMNAILAIADAGDEIVLPVPYYFNHEMAVVMAGAVPVPVQTRRDLQLDLDAIADAITAAHARRGHRIAEQSDGRGVSDEASLRAVNALCRDRGIFHIHDEAYEYFTYDDVPHFSPGAIDGAAAHTISLYSLSKAYGMASWRVGYMVLPESLWDAVNKIQDTLLICAPAVSQRAAVAALGVGAPYATARLDEIEPNPHADVRRAFGCRHAMRRPVVGRARSTSSFAFIRDLQPMALAEHLIREHSVAVIPGSAFGVAHGCSIRVSYGALDAETVTEGLGRLVEGLRTIAGVRLS